MRLRRRVDGRTREGKWVHRYSIWLRRFFFSGLPTDNRIYIHRVRRRRVGCVRFHSPNLTYSDACVSMRGIFGYRSGATVFFFFFSFRNVPYAPPSSSPTRSRPGDGRRVNEQKMPLRYYIIVRTTIKITIIICGV